MSKQNPMLSMVDQMSSGLARDYALRAAQRELIADRMEEFYNHSHDQSGAGGGEFVEGSDGPGRKRDPGTEDLGKPGVNSTPPKGGWLQKRRAAKAAKAKERAADKAATDKMLEDLLAANEKKLKEADHKPSHTEPPMSEAEKADQKKRGYTTWHPGDGEYS